MDKILMLTNNNITELSEVISKYLDSYVSDQKHELILSKVQTVKWAGYKSFITATLGLDCNLIACFNIGNDVGDTHIVLRVMEGKLEFNSYYTLAAHISKFIVEYIADNDQSYRLSDEVLPFNHGVIIDGEELIIFRTSKS